MPGVLKAKVGGSWVEIPQVPSPPAQDMYRVFATKALLDTNWPYPPEGAQAYVVADRMMWIYAAGTGWISPAPRGYLAEATITANSNTNATASYVNVTGLVITHTVPVPNRRYRLTGLGSYGNATAAAWAFFSLGVDGSPIGTQARLLQSTAGQGMPFTLTRTLTPTAGSHTFSIMMSNPYVQGACYLLAASSDIAQVTIEDIGSAV